MTSNVKVSKFKVPGEGSSLAISIVTVVTLIVLWFLSIHSHFRRQRRSCCSKCRTLPCKRLRIFGLWIASTPCLCPFRFCLPLGVF